MQRMNPTIEAVDPYVSTAVRAVMKAHPAGLYVMLGDHQVEMARVMAERDNLEAIVREQARDLEAARRTIDTLNGNLAYAQRRVIKLSDEYASLYTTNDSLQQRNTDLVNENGRLRTGYERALQHVAANTPSQAPDATDDSAGFPMEIVGTVSIFDEITGTAQHDEAGHNLMADCGPGEFRLLETPQPVRIEIHAQSVTINGNVTMDSNAQ